MLTNVIDRRKHPYRFKKVTAIIEPTQHNNQCKNADQAKNTKKMNKSWIGYDEQQTISVQEAFHWAATHKDEITLYLYDHNDGIKTAKSDNNGKNSSK